MGKVKSSSMLVPHLHPVVSIPYGKGKVGFDIYA